MVVIADTSPVNYLVLIAAIEILPKLYGGVIVPQPVLEELRHLDAPKPVVEWANDLPEWVEVVATVQLNIDADLAELDAGEAAAIGLAQAHPDAATDG
jgi:predicted nucleic acid-binding protein